LCASCDKELEVGAQVFISSANELDCITTRLWNFIFIEGDWLYCMLSKKHDMKNPRNKSTVFYPENAWICCQ
jgi:hypothetical protein